MAALNVRLLVVAAAMAVLLSLAGCRGVSRSNYRKVTEGMARSEVEAILGKGEEIDASEVDLRLFQPPRMGPGAEARPKDSPLVKRPREQPPCVRWGKDETKHSRFGFIDDEVAAKYARIPY